MLKNFFIFCFLCIFSVNIFADLTSFGLEINKSTLEEVKKIYPNGNESPNELTTGKNYEIDVKNINIPGITALFTAFDQNNILVGITAIYEKDTHDALLQELKTKYQAGIHSEDLLSSFKDGDITITMLANSKMPMVFITYYNSYYGKLLEQGKTLEKLRNK